MRLLRITDDYYRAENATPLDVIRLVSRFISPVFERDGVQFLRVGVRFERTATPGCWEIRVYWAEVPQGQVNIGPMMLPAAS